MKSLLTATTPETDVGTAAGLSETTVSPTECSGGIGAIDVPTTMILDGCHAAIDVSTMTIFDGCHVAIDVWTMTMISGGHRVVIGVNGDLRATTIIAGEGDSNSQCSVW